MHFIVEFVSRMAKFGTKFEYVFAISRPGKLKRPEDIN